MHETAGVIQVRRSQMDRAAPGLLCRLCCVTAAGQGTPDDRPVERVGDRMGVVPNAIMLDIDEALRLHLGL
jgi:hypothetical protein